ncbi:MAG: geranylgeranyl reductase family protein [Chloroflexi bacterium]|nr:geranylgeranyl reductase family protein [Chloroflexota bacterium]
MTIDTVVVGAGPAGATAAREIAARGRGVVLLDRARFPRDKPCGGGVTVRCASLLPFDLAPVVEQVVTGAVLEDRAGRRVVRETGVPLTYLTQRAQLDAYLVEQAQAAGAEFRDGQHVRSVVQQRDGTYELRLAPRAARAAKGGGPSGAGGEVLRARTVVGADGANGVVTTQLSFAHPSERAIALEGLLPCPDGVPAWLRGRVVLSLAYLPGGYAWLFPKADHINIGLGGWEAAAGARLRPALDAYCRAHGFDPATLVALRGHHLPLQAPGMTVAAGGAALVGDAAALVDPLSGEGIYAAIASGIAVAPAVDDYLAGATRDLAGYQLALTRELGSELAASRDLMEVFHACPEPFAFALMRSRRVWGAAVALVRGETTYERITHRTGPIAATLGPLARVARRVSRRRYGAR